MPESSISYAFSLLNHGLNSFQPVYFISTVGQDNQEGSFPVLRVETALVNETTEYKTKPNQTNTIQNKTKQKKTCKNQVTFDQRHFQRKILIKKRGNVQITSFIKTF